MGKGLEKANRVAEVPTVPEEVPGVGLEAPMLIPLIPDMPPEEVWAAAPAASSPGRGGGGGHGHRHPDHGAHHRGLIPAREPSGRVAEVVAGRTDPRNNASPANQAAPAVNAVTRAMTGTREPQDHTMLIMARHISTCRPMLITASLRDSPVTIRHKITRYQAHTTANTAVSATRTASLVTTRYPFASKAPAGARN